MRIIKLIIGENVYTDNITIQKELHKNSIHWLDTPEFENAILEIKDGKLYWYSGTWYFGDVEYLIWLDGVFMYGNWLNGIFYNGLFKNGTWYDGIFMNGVIEGGEFLKGDFRNPIKKGGVFRNGLDNNIKESVIRFKNYKK